MRPVLLVFLWVTLYAHAAEAAVLVVDSAGSGYVDIQPAVLAAADGDTILVKSGTYGPVHVEHKGLTIVADTGANVLVKGGILIRNTLIPHRVVLRGLESRGDQSPTGKYPYGLWLEVARGPVRAEDCTFVGSDGYPLPVVMEEPGAAGVFADVALDLSFHDCVLRGGKGVMTTLGGPFSAGGHGIEAQATVVSLHQCLVTGGAAAPGDDLGDGAPGGHGLWAHDHPTIPGLATTIHGAGSHFEGTDGTTDLLCFVSGNGGNGVFLEGALTSATLLDNTYAWGKKGSCGVGGIDGQAILAQGGASYTLLPGASRDLQSNAPVRELGTLTLAFDGEFGDTAYLLAATSADQQLVLPWSGTYLMGSPPLGSGVFALGTVSGSGSLTLAFPIPPFPASLAAATIYLQSAYQDTNQQIWLASPTTIVLLDQSY